MNKRHYEHTLPNIRGSLSNTYSKQTFRSVPEEWEISGAYICEVITVRLIQQYE